MIPENKYWVLVHSNRNTPGLNGKPLEPVDLFNKGISGMLVFSSEGLARNAAEEQTRLYGYPCRPVLLGQESDMKAINRVQIVQK